MSCCLGGDSKRRLKCRKTTGPKTARLELQYQLSLRAQTELSMRRHLNQHSRLLGVFRRHLTASGISGVEHTHQLCFNPKISGVELGHIAAICPSPTWQWPKTAHFTVLHSESSDRALVCVVVCVFWADPTTCLRALVTSIPDFPTSY